VTKPTKEKRKVGRPSIFTDSMMDAICARLSLGESMRKICLDPDMPDQVTIFRWLRENELFRQQYTRAREEQAETLADEIIGIADDDHNDQIIDDQGTVRQNTEYLQRSRLRVEARKWVASKLKPKKYGDRLDLSSTDGSMTPKAAQLDAKSLSTQTLTELLEARERSTTTN